MSAGVEPAKPLERTLGPLFPWFVSRSDPGGTFRYVGLSLIENMEEATSEDH
jgi:hypothetical protein